MNEYAVAVVGTLNFYINIFKFLNNLITNGKYSGDLIILTSRFSPTFLISDIRKQKM